MTQQDPEWGDQHGGPADEQAGNGKAKRDTQGDQLTGDPTGDKLKIKSKEIDTVITVRDGVTTLSRDFLGLTLPETSNWLTALVDTLAGAESFAPVPAAAVEAPANLLSGLHGHEILMGLQIEARRAAVVEPGAPTLPGAVASFELAAPSAPLEATPVAAAELQAVDLDLPAALAELVSKAADRAQGSAHEAPEASEDRAATVAATSARPLQAPADDGGEATQRRAEPAAAGALVGLASLAGVPAPGGPGWEPPPPAGRTRPPARKRRTRLTSPGGRRSRRIAQRA